MTTNKENNLAKYGGQKPKLKHFATVPEVSYFPKHSDLKDTNSQKHNLTFMVRYGSLLIMCSIIQS